MREREFLTSSQGLGDYEEDARKKYVMEDTIDGQDKTGTFEDNDHSDEVRNKDRQVEVESLCMSCGDQ